MPATPRLSTVATMDDQRVMSLVELVLAQPLEARALYLRQACAGDSALFDTVWRYVEWDERIKHFLVNPVAHLPAGEPAPEPALEPGHMLENRFRIIRRVAAGGMGVVYEAWDEKLGRRIAVKCAKAGYHARLSPEVLHASEINHPNVCKTWEIHTGSGPQGRFDFLTMEFINGPTLAEQLRQGPLPAKEAALIVNQICAGLAEAHRHRVIHGDLKCNNVLLSPEPGGVRAVITDFGLARPWLTTGPAVASGELGGTLDYMAPELLKGERPSAASDVYALGVILHEMASGRTPFDDTVLLKDRIARPPAPLQHPWGRIIARCLEPDASRRLSNISDICKALVPFPLLRWSAIAAAVLVAAVAGAAAYRSVGMSPEVVRLAVLPFATDPGSKSLSDGLLQDTADRLRRVGDSRKKLTVIPVRDAVRNNVDAPEKAASLLGATHILTGTLRRGNGRVSAHAVLMDARSRLPLTEWDADYGPDELGSMPGALAGLVTGTLRLPPLPITRTVNAAAYPDFTAGVGWLQRDTGVDKALPLLARAVALDPNSPLTHARLAEAQARKYRMSLEAGWLEKARLSLYEARKRNLDIALVWLVSGRINEYRGLYEEAESDLGRALELDPRDGDALRRLGQVYEENNRFPEAISAFKKAIEVQPGYFGNYRDLCSLYTYQASYSAAIEQCEKVVQLAPDYSDGHFALAVVYFKAGNTAGSETEFLMASRLDPASAKALYGRAFALTSQGHWTQAIPLFERAIAVGPVTHLLYSDLGTTYRLAGFPSKAANAYRAGRVLANKELEQNPRDTVVRAQLAYLCARLGERDRANSEAKQALHLAPGSVEVAWWRALTRDALGERDAAIDILEGLPDDILRRLAREADLAELRHSSRFLQLMASRNIQ